MMHEMSRARLCSACVMQIERIERQTAREPIESLIVPASWRTSFWRKTIWRITRQRGLTAAKPDQTWGKNRELFIAGRDMVRTCGKERSISQQVLGATISVFDTRVMSIWSVTHPVRELRAARMA